MYQFNRKEYEERMKWYQDARFGMFIHWGLYSIPARGEWVRSTEEMPEEEYLPFMSLILRIMIQRNGRERQKKPV